MTKLQIVEQTFLWGEMEADGRYKTAKNEMNVVKRKCGQVDHSCFPFLSRARAVLPKTAD